MFFFFFFFPRLSFLDDGGTFMAEDKFLIGMPVVFVGEEVYSEGNQVPQALYDNVQVAVVLAQFVF